MFITKMNNMFHKHGRIAFGLLTLVIVVPMVLYFSAAPSEIFDMFDFRTKNSHVQMNGKSVSQDVLDNAITDTLITMASSGQNVDFENMRKQENVIEQAVNRIRLLKVVEERGLSVDDMSVAGYIRQLPMFQVKGVFNVNMYKMFVSYYLGRYGMNEKQFEETIRGNLLMDMLRSQTLASTIVTVPEVQQYYNDLNKTYDIQAVRFTSKDFMDKVKPTTEDLQKYFNENKAKYLIPAEYKIDVVRFNFIKYKEEAEKQITDEQIADNYKTNKETYKGKSEKEAKAEIRVQLVNAKIEKNAGVDAQKFAVDIYKQIETAINNKSKEKPQVIFNKYAGKQNLTVYSSDKWITATTTVIPRLGKVPEVTTGLNRLYMDQPISNAIQGKNAFFVVLLKDKINPRQAKFDEVKDKITAEYKAYEAIQLAQKAAEKAYENIQKADSVEKGLTELNTKAEDVPSFSQKNYMPLVSVPDGIQMFQSVVNINKGSVSKPIVLNDGAMLVYLKSVTLPAADSFNKDKKSITDEYRQFKEWLLWTNYEEMLKLKSNTVISESK